MRTGKNSFRHQSLQDADAIAELLASLVSGIQRGKVSFSDDDGKILMHPSGLLHLLVRASQEDGSNESSIEISWQSEEKQSRANKKLSISAG